jgi:dTDP-4-amino-4,6-dideoxygalactose transaminase
VGGFAYSPRIEDDCEIEGGCFSVKPPFCDLKPQFVSIETEVQSAIHEVFRTRQFILGPHMEELEQTIAQYCNTRYAIGVASGSDALILSLMALGIGPGDEVILLPFTFFATGGAVSRVGATPVFVDIDPTTFNIHPPHIEEKITP